MALRRKYQSPPFEVMGGSNAARRPVSSGPPEPEPVVMDEAPRSAEPQQTFLERARRPMIVRLPRGYAALLVLLLVGLLCLAYGVGYSKGQKEARTAAELALEEENRFLAGGDLRPAPNLDGSRPGGTGGPTQAAARQLVLHPVDVDPRVVDMNYLILAEYPLDEAQRLQRYLGQQQLEAAIISRNNGRFHVVDLRAFAPGAVGGAEYQQHINRLKQLGRLWKQNHRGPTDLSDLWPQKYKAGHQ